ncbi:MAG: sigma-70 family RNA polymerase sigma factor [Phycisphaerales bacterium]|nr:sigma-70 family RNA polymerase sigma factor [Phycisphaerales bacterium]
MDTPTLSFLLRLARIKAGQVAQSLDPEDTAQDLVLEVLIRFPKFDPDRATAEAFVEQVMKGKVCKLLRDRQRLKRGGTARSPGPLPERADPSDFIRDADLRMDLETVLEHIPDALRAACDQLQRETVSEAARAIGVPRSTLDSALNGLQSQFRKASLDRYLS